MPGSDEGARDRKARRARVVIAEDDARMLEVMAVALRADGHDVVEVAGAALSVPLAALVGALGSLDADVLILDVRAPAPSGVATLEALRAAGHETPAILLASFADAEGNARAAAVGGHVLDKPFTMQRLRAEVNAALEEREG